MKKTLLTVVMAAAVMMSGCESNPLIKPAKTPFGAPEFTKIKIEHYMPAFEQGLKEARAELEATINNPEAPTFENTIEAMERGGELLNYVSNIFFVLDGNETSPEMQELALEIQPKLVEFYNDLNLNPTLWQRVKTVYEQRESLGLNEEQAKLLENTYKDFVRSGANLSDEAKEEYRKISTELSMLTLKFGQNVLAATNAFTLNITNPEEVAELPDFVKEILAAEAKAHEQEGWTVSLQPASMSPFLTYSSNRGYKEQVWKAYNSRCIGGELDNTELIKQITDLRLRSAQLLGYPTYADFVLEKRMAENPTTVNNFLDELLDATIGQARKEVAEVQRYARKNGAKYELMPWDFAYWSEKYKNATYAYNEEDVKPYFELNNVKNGIFALCDKLYGIKFVENKEVDGYHPDVQVYEVREENGELLGLLYMDFFPRATKRGGAWMTSFRDVYVDKDGKEVRPLISMCGNVTKPTDTTPSLLTFDEFETFLHEFGHCLHGLFGKGSYASLTGTSVYRDFVELPSQIMENWCVEPEFLDMVATHYQTGEKMPAELRDKVIKAKKFLVAYYNTRQVAYATSDMQFHTITAPIADAVAFEKEARKECEVLPTVEGCSPCAAFSHIFSGGYAAGYYGYKWAEVLDADACAVFSEKGIFSKDVAGSFREIILSKGGIRHPMDLYVAFRGHKPATQALIDEIVPRK